MTLQVAAAFLIIAAVSGVLFYSNSGAAQEILSVYIPKMESMMSEDGTISTVSLFFNNLFACAMCIGMGVIPFLFLTIWAIVSNAMIIGAVLGLGSSMGTMSWFNAVVFGMLPHGIFELPAVFFSMAMGIYLCQTLTGKIFGKNREEKNIANA